MVIVKYVENSDELKEIKTIFKITTQRQNTSSFPYVD